MGNYQQGTYEVVNKDKYVGAQNPRYLSSWELTVFKTFDHNKNVIKWGAEVVVVPYFSVADDRNRRYMVDLYVEYITKSGEKRKELIEVKPFAQTQPPVKKGRKKKSTFLKELYTFQVNTDKWKAATKYAKQRGMVFRILTEKDIFK